MRTHAALTVSCVLVGCLSVAGPALAQAVDQPRNLAASVAGNTVTLTWQPPVSTSQPLFGYVIEAGPAPGVVAVSLAIGSVLSYATVAPTGIYYVRVRALLASGPAIPSNEIQVVVGMPLAPQNLTAWVSGQAVTVQWTMPTGGPAITGLVLHAGTTAGASDVAVAPLPAGARSLSTSAPTGTYYVRVVAVNAAGAGPASNEVIVRTGPGECTLPATPTNLRALAGQGGVQIQWDPTPGTFALSGYTLGAGSAPGATDLGVFSLPRSQFLGTLAPPGLYYVRLAANRDCGASPFSSDISFTVLPPSGASFIGTWAGTVQNYSRPGLSPIRSFQLTLNASPSSGGYTRLPGLWTDNKGCRHTLIVGGINGLPTISMESLPCDDGDFVLTFTSNNGSTAAGRCNAGPSCTFAMTRR